MNEERKIHRRAEERTGIGHSRVFHSLLSLRARCVSAGSLRVSHQVKTCTRASSRLFTLSFIHCLLISCALSFALLPAHSFAETNVSTETRAGRLAVFDDVWATIGSRYYDPSMHGVDWAQQRATFRPLAEEARTNAEFYATLRRMIAPLHDAHTRVYAPDERFEWDHPTYISVGFNLREIGGALVVARVEHDSQAQRAGVRAGDELLSIDGEPIRLALTRRAEEGASASTSRATRLSTIAHLFAGVTGTTVSLKFVRENGGEKSVVLTRVLETREPRVEVRRIDSVSVIRFNLFTEGIAAALVRALRDHKSLRDAPSLIIDLRENGGGEAEAMIDITSAFLPAGSALGQFTDRAGHTVGSPQSRRAMLFAAEEIAPFRGRVVLLTSARTASAAEIFAAALHEAGRAQIIGEQTCGCVLAIRTRHALPDGGLLDVSEMDYRTARGLRLEGAGIAPDETITPTRRDVEQARDPALLRAVALLRRTKHER